VKIEPEVIKATETVIRLADENGELESIYQSAVEFERLYLSAPGLRQLLLSFELSSGKKKVILKSLFEGRLSPYFLGLLYLLVEMNKLHKAASVVHFLKTKAERILSKRMGLIILPLKPSEDLMQELTKLAQAIANDKLVVTFKEDPEIIGGFLMRVGDKLIDASVRGKLFRFKKSVKERL
jgi:F-type H+-transporting ATPase subunit delta